MPGCLGRPTPFGLPVTMGRVGGFSIQVQIKHSPHECLSQNVKVMTYVAMLALMCVCVVCIVSLHILVCMCAMFDVFTEQGPPPRINEILTPKACLTLLVNIYIYKIIQKLFRG